MIQRLRPRLHKLALKHGLDPVELDALCERHVYQCAVCLEPFVEPHIYFWPAPDGTNIARGVICSLCKGAIERCSNELYWLKRHKRFRVTSVRLRERLGRIMNLDAYRGPFDPPHEIASDAPAPSSSDTDR